jgi:hypothetical protein
MRCHATPGRRPGRSRNDQPISEHATLGLPLSVPQRSRPDTRFESSLPSQAALGRGPRCSYRGAMRPSRSTGRAGAAHSPLGATPRRLALRLAGTEDSNPLSPANVDVPRTCGAHFVNAKRSAPSDRDKLVRAYRCSSGGLSVDDHRARRMTGRSDTRRAKHDRVARRPPRGRRSTLGLSMYIDGHGMPHQ